MMPANPAPRTARTARLDWRTAALLLGAALLGAAWAAYNLASTDGARGTEQMRPLIWAIFAGPFALFLGWVIARPREVWLAAFTSFCLYFFMPFVAQRIESLVMPMEQARATGHELYFQVAIGLHLLAGIGVAIWRSRTPYARPAPPAITDPAPNPDPAEGATP